MVGGDARRDNGVMQSLQTVDRVVARSASSRPGPVGIAVAGLVALAVAMGIGRFAFTPIMPMMEADAGLTLRGAGWLAA